MTSANEIDHAQETAQHERSLRIPVENVKLLDERRDWTLQAAASGRHAHPIDLALKAKTLADAGQARK